MAADAMTTQTYRTEMYAGRPSPASPSRVNSDASDADDLTGGVDVRELRQTMTSVVLKSLCVSLVDPPHGLEPAWIAEVRESWRFLDDARPTVDAR